jgi:hypothetical protein
MASVAVNITKMKGPIDVKDKVAPKNASSAGRSKLRALGDRSNREVVWALWRIWFVARGTMQTVSSRSVSPAFIACASNLAAIGVICHTEDLTVQVAILDFAVLDREHHYHRSVPLHRSCHDAPIGFEDPKADATGFDHPRAEDQDLFQWFLWPR